MRTESSSFKKMIGRGWKKSKILRATKRHKTIKNILNLKTTAILMDTPYRLKRVLEEFQSEWGSSKKKIFVAMDLNTETEELRRGTPKELLSVINDFKREFVVIVSE